MNLFCNHKNKNNSGFTIIEIVIVIVIIGIIAGIVLVVYPNYKRNAIENALKSDLINAKSGLASSMNFNDHYPSSADCNKDNPPDGCPKDTDDTIYFYLTPEGYTDPDNYELYATRDGIVYKITNDSEPVKITTAVFISISVGSNISCANAVNGKVYCWGSGGFGDPSITKSLVPIEVKNISKIKKLSVGSSDICAIDSTGKAYCWGSSSVTPKLVNTDNLNPSKKIIDISIGSSHKCIQTSDNKLYCWGKNNYGQLGDGTIEYRSKPVNVSVIGNNIKLVSISNEYSCAIADDSKVYCWGNNIIAQLGYGYQDNNSHLTPTNVIDFESFINFDIKYLSSKSDSSCVISNDNHIYCWGDNYENKLGSSDTNMIHEYPLPVDKSGEFGLKNIKYASVGAANTCSISTDNEAYCWGSNWLGQLGDGTSGYKTYVPHKVSTVNLSTDEKFSKISTGYHHSCAISSLYKVYCWGENTVGQIGNNGPNNVNVLTPTPIIMPSM